MSAREQQNVASIAAWAMKVNGAPLAPATMDQLISAEVDNSLEVPDMAVLRFHDNKLQLVESTIFALGAVLEISVMQAGRAVSPPLFQGEITALEPSFEESTAATLTIRGYDKRHRLNRETKTRNFLNVKDSDIVTQLARNAGLACTCDATAQVRETVFQQNQTDLEFLGDLARRNGYEIAIDQGALQFRRRKTNALISLDWGQTLLSFQPRLSLAGQVNSVTVRGWDNTHAKVVVGQASSSKSAPAVGLGKSGGEAAQAAISSATHYEVRQVITTASEATAIAQRILDDINADFIEAEGVAIGAVEVRAGKIVDINKIGAKFSGKYHVTSATHVLDDSGYRVYFHIAGSRPKMMSHLVAPNAEAAQPYVGAVSALVTNINDPENMGRVKLKFPWYDDAVETGWARIAMPGAGQQRGLFVLPEINDEVLVVFEHGDMDRPYVLGGLYSATNKPPLKSSEAVAEGKVVERMFKTTAGHVLQFTEKSGQKSIVIKDSQNKMSVTMDATNSEMKTKSQGKYEVEAQGAITVKSSSATVTIEATGDIKIKSNANITIESAANLQVKGSVVTVQANGPLALKGNPVQIN